MLISYKIQKRKIFFVAKVKKSIFTMDFFTGKLRDQGSKFSHETPKEAAGGLAYKGNFFFFNFTYENPVNDCSLTGFVLCYISLGFLVFLY